MSRVAERRALANHWPRTALTIIVVIMPRMTNTIIISMNVKPATRQRRENERLGTDASSLRLGTCDVLSTGKAHAERASLRTGTRSRLAQRQYPIHVATCNNPTWYSVNVS